MGLLDKLLGSGIKEVADGVSSAIDKFVETGEEKKAAALLVAKMEQEPAKWQAEINKVEASHPSIFVAGWRPAIGWICAVSLGAYFIPKFLFASFLWVKTCIATNSIVTYPVNADGLVQLILALLGMGAIRMVEKLNGVAR